MIAFQPMRPVPRRIAIRNLARDAHQVWIGLFGAALATAIITSSFVVSGGIERQQRLEGIRNLGPVDVVVEMSDPSTARKVADRLEQSETATASGVERLAGLIDGLPLPAELLETSARLFDKSAPDVALIGIDATAASGFGNDPRASGLTGPNPPAGHALVTDIVAKELDAKAGSTILVGSGDLAESFIVDRLIPSRGIAALSFESASFGGRSIIVGPGVPTAIGNRAAAAANNQSAAKRNVSSERNVRDLLLLSAQGDETRGAIASGPLVATLQRNIELVGFQGPGSGSSVGVVAPVQAVIRPVKAMALEEARRASRHFLSIFAGIGVASVLAGLCLLATVLALRGNGRESEISALRSIGLRRIDVFAGLAIEGWAFSLASAAIGAAIGALISPVLGYLLRHTLGTQSLIRPRLDLVLLGLAVGFGAAILSSLATSAITAGRSSLASRKAGSGEDHSNTRLGVADAVSGPFAAIAGATAISVMLLSWWIGGRALWPALVTVLVILVLALAALPKSAMISRVVASGLAFSVTFILPKLLASRVERSGLSTFVFLAVTLLLCGLSVGITAYPGILRLCARFIERTLGRRRPNLAIATRVGVSYSGAERTSAVLVLATITLVVSSLVGASTAAAMLSGQVDERRIDAKGGFDLLVRLPSSGSVPDAQILAAGASRTARLPVAVAEVASTSTTDQFRPIEVGGVPSELITGGPPRLLTILPGVPDAAEAYALLTRQLGSAIVSEDLFAGPGRPAASHIGVDDEFFIRDVAYGRSLTVKVVGVRPTSGSLLPPVALK